MKRIKNITDTTMITTVDTFDSAGDSSDPIRDSGSKRGAGGSVVGGAVYSRQKIFNPAVSDSYTSRASSQLQFSSMPELKK